MQQGTGQLPAPRGPTVTDAFSQISWTAVVLASAASIALGGIWFGALVSKQYLVVLGRDNGERPATTVVSAVGPLVCTVVTVLTSAVLVAALDLSTTGDAVVFGLVVGVGYQLAMTFQIAFNPNFPHPVRYGLLNAPFFLVSSLVTSLLLVLV